MPKAQHPGRVSWTLALEDEVGELGPICWLPVASSATDWSWRRAGTGEL